MWIFIILGITFIFLGLAVHKFKWYFLISGYNTMSKEKKKNVDTEGLGRLMGIYSYTMGGISIASALLYQAGLTSVITVYIVLLIISTIFMIIRSRKFDGNLFNENGKFRKGAWKQLVPSMIIMGLTLIFVAILFYFSSQSTEVTFHDEGVEIHGMYGDTYLWKDIESIELHEELPTITRRTNGSAVGQHLKGHFKTEEYGSVKLFIHKKTPAYIYLNTEEKLIIFNTKELEETEEIFNKIIQKIE